MALLRIIDFSKGILGFGGTKLKKAKFNDGKGLKDDKAGVPVIPERIVHQLWLSSKERREAAYALEWDKVLDDKSKAAEFFTDKTIEILKAGSSYEGVNDPNLPADKQLPSIDYREFFEQFPPPKNVYDNSPIYRITFQSPTEIKIYKLRGNDIQGKQPLKEVTVSNLGLRLKPLFDTFQTANDNGRIVAEILAKKAA